MCRRKNEGVPEEPGNPARMLSFFGVLTLIALGGYLLMRPDSAPAPPTDEELMPWQAPKPKAARRPDPKPEPAPREKTRFDEQREEIEKEREERAELIEIEMRDIPITIYCTDDNANCKEARAWFDENDYRFEEFDVKSDGRFQRERDRLNPSKSIPTIIVGETVFDKFDAKTIEGELRKLALEEVDS